MKHESKKHRKKNIRKPNANLGRSETFCSGF